ncbi:MAG: MATE family efflux transporter [Candidatus Polarisedimenticolia bacterium]
MIRRLRSSEILSLAAPLVVSFWMRSLFSLVDTAYAATLGDSAVAAVGLSLPLEFLMIACWVGVSTGLTSTLSRAMGAGDQRRVEDLLASARGIVLLLVPAFLLLGGGVLLAAPHLGLQPDVAKQFGIYTSVLVAGSALSSFWSILPDSIVKAHHDTRSTMWAGIWSNVINVVLNTIFTFVFHWGVFGIAFSTVVGRLGGLAYALRRAAALEAARLAKAHPSPPATAKPARVPAIRAILSLAVPSAATYGLMATESTLVNVLLATLENPTAAIAAYSIYFRVLLLAVMPVMATGVAVLPYVARRLGENDTDGVRRGLREACLASVVYVMVLVAPALWLGAPAIARALGESEVTERFTVAALRACPVAVLAMIPFILVRPAFEGMQRGRPGLAVALLRYVVLTIPMAMAGTWVARGLGLPSFVGMLGGLIGATAIASIVFLIWIRAALGELRPEATAQPAD